MSSRSSLAFATRARAATPGATPAVKRSLSSSASSSRRGGASFSHLPILIVIDNINIGWGDVVEKTGEASDEDFAER
ncbi:unnamed protein product [Bathycoccus prasinos]